MSSSTPTISPSDYSAPITIEQISEIPCWYEGKIVLAKGRTSISLLELSHADLPIDDAFWVCAKFLTPQDARLLACDIAEQIVGINCDASSTAISVSRRYAVGDATHQELTIARDTTRNASWHTARATADCAAWSTAWAAARSVAVATRGEFLDADWSAAWDAAWSKYLTRLRQYATGEAHVTKMRVS